MLRLLRQVHRWIRGRLRGVFDRGEIACWTQALQNAGRPLILHCPHGQFENGITPALFEIFEGVARQCHHRTCISTSAERPLFLTYSNRRRPTLLHRMAASAGIKVENVLLDDSTPWSWMSKVGPVRRWLEAADPRPLACYVADGFDVFPFGNPPPAAEVLQRFGCRILFCPTPANWPPEPSLAKFEEDTYGTFACHLSAGAYVAETAFLLECLQEMEQAANARMPWCLGPDGAFDDQLAWRHLHRKYPKAIRVDAHCELFARFDHFLPLHLPSSSSRG